MAVIKYSITNDNQNIKIRIVIAAATTKHILAFNLFIKVKKGCLVKIR